MQHRASSGASTSWRRPLGHIRALHPETNRQVSDHEAAHPERNSYRAVSCAPWPWPPCCLSVRRRAREMTARDGSSQVTKADAKEASSAVQAGLKAHSDGDLDKAATAVRQGARVRPDEQVRVLQPRAHRRGRRELRAGRDELPRRAQDRPEVRAGAVQSRDPAHQGRPERGHLAVQVGCCRGREGCGGLAQSRPPATCQQREGIGQQERAARDRPGLDLEGSRQGLGDRSSRRTT